MFSKFLDEFMEKYNISNVYLSKESGLSASYISRIRTGARKPKSDSEVYEKIYQGLLAIKNKRNINEQDLPASKDEFLAILSKDFKLNEFSKSLNNLMDFFKVTNKSLATYLICDPSLISRYRSGDTTPDFSMIKKMSNFF